MDLASFLFGFCSGILVTWVILLIWNLLFAWRGET